MANLSHLHEDNTCSLLDVRQPKPVAPRVYIVSEVRLYWEGLISSLARRVISKSSGLDLLVTPSNE